LNFTAILTQRAREVTEVTRGFVVSAGRVRAERRGAGPPLP
jgi:hypothetical protein